MTRILIADNHDVVRSGLRAILSGEPGWEVVAEAEDGRQAVELAAATQPDVAILGYRLPVMNGIDATRQIRAFHPRTDPGSPKFGRFPATTTPPFGLTAGWSTMPPSENVQRDCPLGATDSRYARLREKYTDPSGPTLGGDMPFEGHGE